jgi:hypothetical protein
MLTSLYLIVSGQAKPSKKAKTSKPGENINITEDPQVANPEKQTLSESLHQTSEAAIDDPPPKEHNVIMDSMDVDPARAKPPSPIKPAEEKADDVIITRTRYVEPDNPTILAKHSTKEEFSAADKGKWKLDLEGYAQFNAQELHAGYLNRLHTSCDFEAGLVNLMKERFEVNTEKTLHVHISVSRQVYCI